jgi:hypothetical protein
MKFIHPGPSKDYWLLCIFIRIAKIQKLASLRQAIHFDKCYLNFIYLDIFLYPAIIKSSLLLLFGAPMKYILLLSFLVSPFSFATEPEQAQIAKDLSALEYCHANPDHKPCKEIHKILDWVKPCPTISRIWKFVRGKGMFLPDDHMRHFFFSYCKEIGNELNWDEKRIYEEGEKLYAEVNRIRKGNPTK